MTLSLKFQGHHKHGKGSISRIDKNSGNMHAAYQQMGSPAYPTVEQITGLKKKSEMKEPEPVHLDAQGQITLAIPPNGVVLLELT